MTTGGQRSRFCVTNWDVKLSQRRFPRQQNHRVIEWETNDQSGDVSKLFWKKWIYRPGATKMIPNRQTSDVTECQLTDESNKGSAESCLHQMMDVLFWLYGCGERWLLIGSNSCWVQMKLTKTWRSHQKTRFLMFSISKAPHPSSFYSWKMCSKFQNPLNLCNHGNMMLEAEMWKAFCSKRKNVWGVRGGILTKNLCILFWLSVFVTRSSWWLHLSFLKFHWSCFCTFSWRKRGCWGVGSSKMIQKKPQTDRTRSFGAVNKKNLIPIEIPLCFE